MAAKRGRGRSARRAGPQEPRPLAGLGLGDIETGPDGEDYRVRPISASAAAKTYRCPGCDQSIPPATPHVVAWPIEPLLGDGGDDRRHWHRGCWNSRGTRGVTRRWS